MTRYVDRGGKLETDVAIVGAGPAGSAAAWQLATAGARVVLLERATFPRDKPCGDGLCARGLTILARMGLEEWTCQFPSPESGRITSPDGQVLDLRPPVGSAHCYGRTIPRQLLDARLAEAAVTAGARLVEGTRVRGVASVNGSASSRLAITADGLEMEAHLVIMADGSHAPITRRLGLVREAAELVAIRQYFSGDAGPRERIEIHFQPREVLPGYTWVFPVGDGCVNVGTGTFFQRVYQGEVSLRGVFASFLGDPAVTEGRLVKAEPVGPVRGHPIRTRLDRTRSYADRILVAGDAAGLVNPFTGEGTASALESGQLAATHALSALETGDFSARALACYDQALRARFLADQRAARFLRIALFVPRLFNRVIRKLRHDPKLALLIGYIIIGYKPPRLALRPRTLLQLLA
jgi:geranylgeranyl reductase family protein